LKKSKRHTLSKKDLHYIIGELEFAAGMLEILGLQGKFGRLLGSKINGCAGKLQAAEPAKGSDNSDMPSSMDLAKRKNKPKQAPLPKKPTFEDEDDSEPVKAKGKTRLQIPNPTKTIDLTPKWCRNNPRYRKIGVEKRQLVDVKIQLFVEEYFTEIYEDADTGEKIRGAFPEGVNAPVQFGDALKALAVLLRECGPLSYEKMEKVFEGMFGVHISQGSFVNIIKEFEGSPILDPRDKAARKDIMASPRINADETGCNILGKTHWIHLVASPRFTIPCCHPSRGKKAMDDIGILGEYAGTVVHDCWKPYFLYENFTDAICNSHLLRELELAIEMKQDWAVEMRELLLDAHVRVNCYPGELPEQVLDYFSSEYRRIADIGIMATGGIALPRPPGSGKKGRVAKPKYRNLLDRLVLYEDGVLRFLYDPNVSFTNNDAERPVRTLKVHMKISGCFRSLENAQGYCRMWGYLESCGKHGIEAAKAIRMLVKGETPEFISEALREDCDAEEAMDAA
jgi:transposase